MNAQDVAAAWNGITDRWIDRQNKAYDERQWEVVHDWGVDIISDQIMKVVGRFHTMHAAKKYAERLENEARGAAVLKLFATNTGKIHEAIGLFASAIKCGEPWTSRCEKALLDARVELIKIAT